MKRILRRFNVLFLIPLLLLWSCVSTSSLYDQHAYTQVTALKVEALHVIELAKDPIGQHQKEVDEVLMSLEKIREYESHRPKNRISTEMWKVILDPREGSFGGFVEFWKEQSNKGVNISQTYIVNKKGQVGQHFDKIAELESRKIKK